MGQPEFDRGRMDELDQGRMDELDQGSMDELDQWMNGYSSSIELVLCF